MTRLRAGLRRPFASLSEPNFRLYTGGQLVSLSGTWMQTVAELWLVLTLTASGLALGLTTALQFAPILVLGAWGGLLADRVPKRTLLVATQTAMAALAVVLLVLVASGAVRLWMIYVLVGLRGVVTALDNPVRQSFIAEMVGPELLPSAVGLNSALINAAKLVGPAVAGVLIATAGVTPCFALNALSFLAVLWALRRMDAAQLRPAPLAPRAHGQLRDALHVVARTPALREPLAMVAAIGTLAFNFQVLLPLLARFAYGGGGGTYGALTTAMGVGAVVGALWVAARGRPTRALLLACAVAFGVGLLTVAAAPTLALALVALVPMGAASIAFAATANGLLQLAVAPELRGRVMALYSVVFLGSTPIGGPLTGWLAEAHGPRVALAAAGVATLATAAGAALAGRSPDAGRRRPQKTWALSQSEA